MLAWFDKTHRKQGKTALVCINLSCRIRDSFKKWCQPSHSLFPANFGTESVKDYCSTWKGLALHILTTAQYKNWFSPAGHLKFRHLIFKLKYASNFYSMLLYPTSLSIKNIWFLNGTTLQTLVLNATYDSSPEVAPLPWMPQNQVNTSEKRNIIISVNILILMCFFPNHFAMDE